MVIRMMDNLGEILKRGTSPNVTPSPKNFEEQEYKEPTRENRLAWLGVTDINHTFALMKKPKGFELTFAACRAMATGIAEFFMLMIYGGVGNGKTLCCEAVVIEMFDHCNRVRRDRWSDLVRNMKSHFNGKSTMSYEEYFDGLRNRTHLILDDVGSGSTLGPWEWGELEDIIDYRYEHRLFTIVTTNLEIKNFPERILSRFKDKSCARLVLNEAADYRPLKKAGG